MWKNLVASVRYILGVWVAILALGLAVTVLGLPIWLALAWAFTHA